MLLIQIIIIAFVYGVILMENGMIMSYVYRFFQERINSEIDQDWRFKFWLSCEKCIAGQMALWIYPIYFPYWDFNGLFEHVFFICSVILSVVVLKIAYNRIKNL
jgi:hypothetical protein